MDSFYHVFVPEVVRETRMHFFKVPRLGSFMAVPLVYKSCMFYESLEAAVADWQDVQRRREEQAKEKAQYEAEIMALMEAKHAIGEEYEPDEDREWEDITFAPFATREQRWVLCLDMMGQDIVLTTD